jgi:hypothetical protein
LLIALPPPESAHPARKDYPESSSCLAEGGAVGYTLSRVVQEF